MLLKDVFDYSLEEIAGLVDSTVGGVKAALNRGRSKLASTSPELPAGRRRKSGDAALLHQYVERFNQQDWDGLRELIADDAQLRVADRFVGRLDDSGYFGQYARMPMNRRMAIGQVDGETALIVLYADGSEWAPKHAIRIDVVDGRINRIWDYWHCPWVLPAAGTVAID